MRELEATIHPTAIVHPTAQLADDVEVGPYSIVGEGVTIGAGSKIGPHVVIQGPTRLGRGNRVHQFASIGEAPQVQDYAGEPTRIEIGDGNAFREFVTVNRGSPRGPGVTRIGSGGLFMAYAHVAHDCEVGDRVVFANAASLAGHVHVGDGASLGGFTTVHQYCRLGERCFTGLSTVVNRDVPPFVLVAGHHAKGFGINTKGLRRCNFAPDLILALQTAYRLLVRRDNSIGEALEELVPLRERYPEVARFADFVTTSKRGIVR